MMTAEPIVNNSIKFIATDMDGTLLNSQKALPADFFEVFGRLQQQGVLFAAASGRQYHSLADTFAAIKDQMVFIAENGTYVVYQGKELHSALIAQQDAYRMIAAVRAIPGSHLVLCGKQLAYTETKCQQALSEIKNYYHSLRQVDDLLAIDDEFIKVAVLNFNSTERHVYPVVAPQFADSHQVVISGEHWLDFMHKEASKGTAIKKLQTLFDFNFEQSMSFGDFLNDVEMLKETYHSYAMANAHPDIKRLARFSAPGNDEQGVTTVIRQQVLRD
ncbi:Cof-type HAD-IIB family hydrolase [Aeromonas veronii]